jgi:hypothetical protein
MNFEEIIRWRDANKTRFAAETAKAIREAPVIDPGCDSSADPQIVRRQRNYIGKRLNWEHYAHAD